MEKSNFSKAVDIVAGIVVAITVVVAIMSLAKGWKTANYDSEGDTTEMGTPAENSENGDATLPAGNNVPPPAAQSAMEILASGLSVPVNTIEIISIEDAQWPSSCLGLPFANEACTQAVTAGYKVTLKGGGDTYIYRTNLSGTVVRWQR